MLKVLMIICMVICALIVAIIGIGLMNAISNLQESIDHIFNKQSDSNTKNSDAAIKEGSAYIDDGK